MLQIRITRTWQNLFNKKLFLNYVNLTWISTPLGSSSLDKASTVFCVGVNISINLLWVRIWNCSRDFLFTCGERNTVNTSFFVGSGIGPDITAPLFLTVFTIFSVLLSTKLWSYDRSLILIF